VFLDLIIQVHMVHYCFCYIFIFMMMMLGLKKSFSN